LLVGKAISKIGAKGYKSYKDFKEAHGKAGEGMSWHHIVEQNPSNLKKFKPEMLHNTKNITKLPFGKGSIHMKINGYYSSKPDFTGGQTVRDWLSSQSFRRQYKFGLKAIKQFGSEL